MAMTHQRWGKLPWPKLFEPAIRLAEGGFTVSRSTGNLLRQWAEIWKDFPDARKIYWRDGRPLTAGETVRNPALADSLRQRRRTLASLIPELRRSEGDAAAYQRAAASVIAEWDAMLGIYERMASAELRPRVRRRHDAVISVSAHH